MGELIGGMLEGIVEGDSLGPGHKKAEGHGLRVAVCEALVIGFRKEKTPPIHGQGREGWALLS